MGLEGGPPPAPNTSLISQPPSPCIPLPWDRNRNSPPASKSLPTHPPPTGHQPEPLLHRPALLGTAEAGGDLSGFGGTPQLSLPPGSDADSSGAVAGDTGIPPPEIRSFYIESVSVNIICLFSLYKARADFSHLRLCPELTPTPPETNTGWGRLHPPNIGEIRLPTPGTFWGSTQSSEGRCGCRGVKGAQRCRAGGATTP
ncbi:interferon-inducible GTPase 5-like [Platysternon megacephalum]|uniref:Interferon-inducible GTPase 5-like n=1 Tax=Platysternon megacephalum TaxID=55544 RepID=A0A4D9DUC5_9SAUR|nr:interferon-inducible GTPase 5-like [Platysternon megacephalum]